MEPSKESHRLLQLDRRFIHPESQQQENQTQQRTWLDSLKGIIAALMQVVSYVASITSVQLLERRIPDFELQAIRCMGVVISCMIWVLIRQRFPVVPLSDVAAVLFHGFFASLGSLTTCVGFALIPAASGQCSNNTSSLLSGVLIFWFCGQERFSLSKLFCVVLCIVGVLFTLQPWHTTSEGHTRNDLWDIESKDCSLQGKKLCSSGIVTNSSICHNGCTNLTILGKNETNNPCESIDLEHIKADSSSRKFVNESEFNCTAWVLCWCDTVAARFHHVIFDKSKEQEQAKGERNFFSNTASTFHLAGIYPHCSGRDLFFNSVCCTTAISLCWRGYNEVFVLGILLGYGE